MIKSDHQLERTRESIARFHAQIEHVKTLDDEVERELAISSYEGMVSSLQFEIERYLNAKRGIVQMPHAIRNLTDLCPYLTDFRIALGWTQETLGDQLGVSRQAVNQWEEHEYRSITVDRLQEILAVLGLLTTTKVQHNTVQVVERSNDPAFAFAC
jgi:DNA-binding Xre family transcriptional regulator